MFGRWPRWQSWNYPSRRARVIGGRMVSYDQAGFRGYADDAVMGSATPKAVENTGWSQVVDENFRVRFVIDETAGGTGGGVLDFKLQYRKNLGSWQDVNASSLNVRTFASGFEANGNPTARLLTSGSGTFVAGTIDTNNGAAGVSQIVDLDELTELEFCAQVRSADVVDADSIELRIVQTVGTVVFAAYTQIPTITVSEGAGAVAIQASPATIAVSARVGSLALGALAVQGVAATLVVSARVSVPTLAAKVVQASPGVLVTSARAGSLVLGAKIVSATPAAVATSARVGSVVVAAKVVQAAPAIVVVGAQVGLPVVAGAPVVVQGAVAVVSCTARAPSLVLGVKTVQGTVAVVGVSARVGTLTLAAKVVQANRATLATLAQVSVPIEGEIAQPPGPTSVRLVGVTRVRARQGATSVGQRTD